MYYSKIAIDKSKKVISKTITKSLGFEGILTISFLKDLGIGDDDEFCVYEDENNKEAFVSIVLRRLETDEEVAERVAKAEDYNKRYDEYHTNKK